MVLQKYSNISHGKKVLDECLFNRLKYFLSDKQWFILDVMQRGKGSIPKIVCELDKYRLSYPRVGVCSFFA
ncbi:hypothetical protein AREALGSMS7_01073 [Arenibacter algicola]|uniref:Uncharacterized protein n=1 Tax=Arenibacter algicola TaxID=616991 RepID=A0A221UT46_9FLAO|nr:hypothetical protein AREALGSMS7_01073 [Arenibacter algicola]